jgi:hypothetical protein
MKKCMLDRLEGVMLLLIFMLFLISGPAQAQVTVYTDEAVYLNALSAGGYVSFQEGFEDDATWGGVRTFNTAHSIVSKGIRWTSNHPDAITQPSHISTSSGAARTGGWGIFSSPHGDPDAQGSPDVCDVENPPSYCFKKDGFIGTKEPGAGIFYGAGGWVTGISGGKITMILDGNESAPVDFGDQGIITNTHKFFGVIDTQGFTQFEFRETEGKVGDEKYIFADDFTFAVLSCWDNDADGYENETCGGDDCDDVDPNIHPGAAEICDGKDNDCDGVIPTDETTDTDADGVVACLDCDDNDGVRFPGNTEVCDGKDNDCDGNIDEEGASDCINYYKDQDQDGYGVDGDSKCLCNPDIINKYTATQPGDPNDTDPQIPANYSETDLNLPAEWSMISLPVIPPGKKLPDVFPGAIVVYGFRKEAGYVRVTEEEDLEAGKGYWILLYEAKSFPLAGQTIHDYTFSVNQDGWDMIGGCTSEAQASGDNCNIVVIYGYIPGVGYQRVLESENLEPGIGYWILFKDVIDQCTITIKSREP